MRTSAFYSFELITNMSYLMLLSTTACGADLVYWILCLSLAKLVLVGHSKSYRMPLTDVANFLFFLTLHIWVTEYGMWILPTHSCQPQAMYYVIFTLHHNSWMHTASYEPCLCFKLVQCILQIYLCQTGDRVDLQTQDSSIQDV